MIVIVEGSLLSWNSYSNARRLNLSPLASIDRFDNSRTTRNAFASKTAEIAKMI
jgi:hypothetical protein